MLAALVLLLVGCEAGVLVDIAVEPDGGGRLAITVAVDAELRGRAVQAGGDPLDRLVQAVGPLQADGWQVSDELAPGGARRVTVERGFADPAEFNAVAGELTRALAAPELEPLSDLRLAATAEEITLRGRAGLEPTRAVTELGLQPEQAVAVLDDTQALSYEVRVAMPGPVRQATGPIAEDAPRVVRWTIPPGESVQLLVVAQRPGFPWWPLAVGLVALVGLAAVAVYALLRRRAEAGQAP